MDLSDVQEVAFCVKARARNFLLLERPKIDSWEAVSITDQYYFYFYWSMVSIVFFSWNAAQWGQHLLSLSQYPQNIRRVGILLPNSIRSLDPAAVCTIEL